MNRTSRLHLLLLPATLLLAGLILGGCSEDEPPVYPPQPIVEPQTPDELVAGFLTAYGKMDVESYLDLLDPEYLTILQTDTTLEFPDLGVSLDFAEEERIHMRMFSGEAVTDPEGEFRPAVINIVFNHFQILGSWSATDDAENFPDSQWALYEVAIEFDRGQNFSALDVEGTVKIYARAHTKNVDGTDVTHYLMAGMKDLTSSGAKGVNSTPWGSVRAYYR